MADEIRTNADVWMSMAPMCVQEYVRELQRWATDAFEALYDEPSDDDLFSRGEALGIAPHAVSDLGPQGDKK